MAHTLQERYSSLVDAKLRATLVTKDGVIFNTRYEGSPTAGSVKIPVRDTEVVAGTYSKTNGLALDKTGSTTYKTLTIDKDVAVNELIDGFDAAAVPDNLVADRLDSAAYSLALKLEQDAIAVLENTDSSGTATLIATQQITKDNVYEAFVNARTVMSKAKIPTEGRWALVSPDTYAALLQDTTHFIRSTNMGDTVVSDGRVGSIAGFTVYECVSLTSTTNFICGHKDWCVRVQEWQTPVHIQGLDGSGTYIGASAVQGRKCYAHTVTKKAAVQVNKNSGKTIISAVAYAMNVPRTSATPQTSFAAGTGYWGTVTWSPTVTTAFAASTVYTATVVVNANTGYQFDANFRVNDITGLPPTTGSSATASEITVVRDSDVKVTITVKYLATGA